MSPNNVRRRNRRAGFTLFEVLVAMALMGMILAFLATITAHWLPNWDRDIARLQRDEQLALGLERVVADLAAYDRFLKQKLTRLEGIASIESSFALEQVKYTNVLPLE